MKSSRLLLAVATLALLFTPAVSTATASAPVNTWNPWGQIDSRMLVTAIDPVSGTIQFKTMKDKTTHNFKIDAKTQVLVNGARGTIDQVQVGMQIRDVRFRDTQTVASFSVGLAAPPPPQQQLTPAQIVKPPPGPGQ